MTSPIVEALRIGKDDSQTFFLDDGSMIQLSPKQVAVLLQAHGDERGFTPTEQLYGVVFQASGPATPSHRASMSGF
jgi:hypothetical protein